MDLEDLRRIWQEQDGKLSEILRSNARRAAESALRRAETSTRGIAWTVLLDLALSAIPVIWLGSFVADHLRAEPCQRLAEQPGAATDIATGRGETMKRYLFFNLMEFL